LDPISKAVEFFCEKTKEFPKLLAMFSTSDSVDKFNDLVSAKMGIETFDLEAIDSHPTEQIQINLPNYQKKSQLKAKKRKTANTAGLEKNLKVGINSRVILKRNTNADIGLCNGALGVVKSFSFSKDNPTYVTTINVLFDNGVEYSIKRITADYEYQKNIYISRSQFPLSIAYALTIHKCQGMSLDAILVDLGPSIFAPGMAYVALSRARNFKTVFLIDFVPESIYCEEKCILEYNRLIRKFVPNGKTISECNRVYRKFQGTQIGNEKKMALPLISDFEKKTKASEQKKRKTTVQKEAYQAQNYLINYALKLRNQGENSCFSNAIVQGLLSLGLFFYQQVSRTILYLKLNYF